MTPQKKLFIAIGLSGAIAGGALFYQTHAPSTTPIQPNPAETVLREAEARPPAYHITFPTPIPTVTPTPVPTPTPTASPTPLPATYFYHGCQVYNGTAGTADPIANATAAPLPTEPAGPQILASAAPNVHFSSSDDAKLEIVNLADNSTPMLTVQTNGGHNPPISQGAYGGGSGAQFPWVGGTFWIENPNISAGHDHNGGGDGHMVVLNTDTCVVYQAGGGAWVDSGGNGTLKSYNGFIDNLFTDYAHQGSPWSQNKGDNVTVSGTGVFSFTDYEEDFSLAAIPHPIGVILPTSVVVCYHSCGTMGVNYSPGTGADGSCSGSLCLIYGDLLRLPQSYVCPTTSQRATMVCNQMKNYMAVVTDTGSSPTFRFGVATDGSHTQDSALWTWLASLKMTDFELIKRGTLVP